MDRVIVISKTAENKLKKLFDYLLEQWSPKVKNEFVEKLDNCIQIIKRQPEIFPESHKRKGFKKMRCNKTDHFIL